MLIEERRFDGLKRQVVYTALFGAYERLIEQPVSAESDCDFICFTDDLNLASKSWQLIHIDPPIPLDSVRSARQIKILGHEALACYSESLWIDNRIILKAAPEELLLEWLRDFDMSLIAHSARPSVREEFVAVLNGHLDDPARIREQLFVLRTIDPEVLSEVPYWTAIIARRRSDRLDVAMRLWMDCVLRYSRRDQLSLNYAVRKANLPVGVHERDNRASEWHEWLTTRQLPKDKTQRYGAPFHYGLPSHFFDAATKNRIVRHIKWRLSKAQTHGS